MVELRGLGGHVPERRAADDSRRGESAILTLQFVLALREAADLEAAFGGASQAAAYRALADKPAAAVAASCWDAKKGLLADTPDRSAAGAST